MSGPHASHSKINQYVTGALPVAEIAGIEEHLLLCLRCRLEAEDALQFRIAIREALAGVAVRENPLSAPYLVPARAALAAHSV